MDNQFYITLKSNSSIDYFPNNTASKFKVKLANQINLEDRWEVAITEITYPHTWQNLTQSTRCKFIFERLEDQAEWGHDLEDLDSAIIDDLNENEENEAAYNMIDITIPSGYYSSADRLLNAMGHKIWRIAKDEFSIVKNLATFDYDDISDQILIRLHPNGVFYFENNSIAEMLGLQPSYSLGDTPIYQSPIVSKADYNPFEFFKPKQMFIYCDLVQPQFIGTQLLPIIRQFITGTEHGKLETKTFEKLYYMPVAQKTINTIEINLLDDTSQFINFQNESIVTCMLHFRKCGLII